MHPSKISCEWAALANDISAKAVDMIRRDKVKILGPLFQVKHKTAFERESICKWLGWWKAIYYLTPQVRPLRLASVT